ncbi:MAG: ParB N-terminal domain-containing protein [Bacteroidetes bacterium]|nr:ParB N-terminal domain-containing protein [Bacteroidota bacterium]
MNTPLPIGYVNVETSRLVKADWNYKLDSVELAEKLAANIKRNGQIENIIIRQLPSGFYEVVNGNHRYDAMLHLGFTHIMAYNLGSISEQHAQRVAIETNETRFDTDPHKLAKLIEELQVEFNLADLESSLPFNADELTAMLSGMNVLLPSTAEDSIEDDFSAEVADPVSKRGDIYQLGPHRLLCGDSTNTEDVATLMNGRAAHLLFTDPPYNIDYNDLNAKRDGGKDWNETTGAEWTDKMDDDSYRSFLIDFLANAKRHLVKHAHYYVWHAAQYGYEVCEAFKVNEIPFDKVPIIWKKNAAPISYARYKRIYEPCIYGGLGATNGAGEHARWFGDNSEVGVWEISRESVTTYVHPTQKPLALVSRALQNSTEPGDVVLDLFGGSGSTLIACEQMNRICHTMEMDPCYVDVIVMRYIAWREKNDKSVIITRNGQPCIEDFNAT